MRGISKKTKIIQKIMNYLEKDYFIFLKDNFYRNDLKMVSVEKHSSRRTNIFFLLEFLDKEETYDYHHYLGQALFVMNISILKSTFDKKTRLLFFINGIRENSFYFHEFNKDFSNFNFEEFEDVLKELSSSMFLKLRKKIVVKILEDL